MLRDMRAGVNPKNSCMSWSVGHRAQKTVPKAFRPTARSPLATVEQTWTSSASECTPNFFVDYQIEAATRSSRKSSRVKPTLTEMLAPFRHESHMCCHEVSNDILSLSKRSEDSRPSWSEELSSFWVKLQNMIIFQQTSVNGVRCICNLKNNLHWNHSAIDDGSQFRLNL